MDTLMEIYYGRCNSTKFRFTINISFIQNYKSKRVENIVEHVKTMKEAISYKDIIDETVDRALIKDNESGEVTWLKG